MMDPMMPFNPAAQLIVSKDQQDRVQLNDSTAAPGKCVAAKVARSHMC